MGQVAIQLNGRSYALMCGQGEEERLLLLADYVREKLKGVIAEHGQAGDARLLLMTALLIADELFDVRAERDMAASTAAAAALREVADRAKDGAGGTQTGKPRKSRSDAAPDASEDGSMASQPGKAAP